MPTYTLLSRVYLGDVELFELLSPKNVSRRHLLKIARRKGLILGERSEESDIRSLLALLPSSWPLVSEVVEFMASPDREERKTGVHIANCEEKNDIADIVAKTKDERAEKHAERYNTIKVDEKTTKIEVSYVDIDHSKAVVYQRQEKKLVVEVTQDEDKVSIIHSANERATAIVNALKAKLLFKQNLQPEVVRISLNGVREARLRTRFFTELLKSVAGYRYHSATLINVDRRFPADEDEESSEPAPVEAESAKAEAKIRSLVNQVALRGEQVLANDLYHAVESSGYYISNISWTCVYENDSRYHIDCVAGFRDAVNADEFSFDVLRSWRFKTDSPDDEELLPLTEPERRDLNRKLEAASIKAFHSVTNPNLDESQTATVET